MRRHYLWEMRPYFRQAAGQLVLGSIAGIVMNTAVVLPAILLGRAIDAALAFSRGEVDEAAVGWAAVAFVGGTLLTEVARYFKRWWLQTANARIRANVRADALRGVFAWPMERLHVTPIGDLMARIIGDVEVLGVGVREASIEIWDTVLFSLSIIAAMLLFDAGLTALALVPVPAAMLLAHATGRWVSQRTTRAREASSILTASLHEQLAGVRVLRLFGRASAAVERVAVLSRRQADANLAVAQLKGGLQPIYSSMMALGVVLVIWQGGERVVAGTLTVGAFIAYLELFLRFVERGFRVPQLVNSVQSGGAAYARLRPLLAAPLGVHGEPPRASFRPGHVAGSGRPIAGRPTHRTGPVAIELDRVTFRYPHAALPALEDVSLTIPAGSLVAVTGPVGAGKSALARALLGLYPLESGRVLLDGRARSGEAVDERANGHAHERGADRGDGRHDGPAGPAADGRDLPHEADLPHVGYLPQDAYLFSGTVEENVVLFADDGAGEAPNRRAGAGDRGDAGHGRSSGNGVADEANLALDEVVELVMLGEDVRTFPDGLATEIGELGIRLSGGQRQRIALARAVAGPSRAVPSMLVLDDPFSAVDLDTEARIIAGLHRAFGPSAGPARRATMVLCSHRLAAFPRADLVVVLDRGRIVEQGTHDELMRRDGLYARIFRAQRLVQHAVGSGDAAGSTAPADAANGGLANGGDAANGSDSKRNRDAGNGAGSASGGDTVSGGTGGGAGPRAAGRGAAS